MRQWGHRSSRKNRNQGKQQLNPHLKKTYWTTIAAEALFLWRD